MTDLRWEDPPSTRNGAGGRDGRWIEIAAALRSKPGQWAVVDVAPTSNRAASLAAALRNDRYAAMRGDDDGFFEANARLKDGEHRVYARYVLRPKPVPAASRTRKRRAA